MRTTDPRAASFDASAFREAIVFAMNMGMPEDECERATFKWKKEITYSVADPSSRPYRWDETPERIVAKEDCQIPVAIERSPGLASSETAIASIQSPRIIVTVLDEHYASVESADTIEVDGAEYTINFVAPPVSLFEVTVYTIYAQAIDES